MTLAESIILLLLSQGVHGFLADFKLLFVLKGFLFDYTDAYLAYHSSREINWDDEDWVEGLSYVRTGGDMLNTLALQVVAEKRMVIGIQMKRLLGVVTATFKFGPEKMREESVLAAS